MKEKHNRHPFIAQRKSERISLRKCALATRQFRWVHVQCSRSNLLQNDGTHRGNGYKKQTLYAIDNEQQAGGCNGLLYQTPRPIYHTVRHTHTHIHTNRKRHIYMQTDRETVCIQRKLLVLHPVLGLGQTAGDIFRSALCVQCQLSGANTKTGNAGEYRWTTEYAVLVVGGGGYQLPRQLR